MVERARRYQSRRERSPRWQSPSPSMSPAEPSSNASRSPPRSSVTACSPRAGWMHLADQTVRGLRPRAAPALLPRPLRHRRIPEPIRHAARAPLSTGRLGGATSRPGPRLLRRRASALARRWPVRPGSPRPADSSASRLRRRRRIVPFRQPSSTTSRHLRGEREPIWAEAWLSPCPLVLCRNWAICVARDGWLGQN
jgi:hypothetical protein